jgi:hypothetical protein
MSYTVELKDKVIITDPCYDREELGSHSHTIEVLPGTWNVTVEISDETDWGRRVGGLTVYHSSTQQHQLSLIHTDLFVSVDSGQAGVFNWEDYPEKPHTEQGSNDFYERVCDVTNNEKNCVISEGVVTSTGFGDGSYPLFLAKNTEGKVVGIRIEYISEEDPFEEDTDEYARDYWDDRNDFEDFDGLEEENGEEEE